MTLRECGEIDLGHMAGELADIVMGGFGILLVDGDLWEKELGSGHGGKWGHVVLIGDGPKAEQNDWQGWYPGVFSGYDGGFQRAVETFNHSVGLRVVGSSTDAVESHEG